MGAGGRSLGWALYLASSWTWVVGMWLPVRLMDDFGWPGWVAFALPNVCGAAMVGFALRPRAVAAAWRRRHAGVMRLFSLWTIAFHVAFLSWFAGWLTESITGHAWHGAGLGLAALVGAWLVSRAGDRGAIRMGAVVWALSILLLLLGHHTGGRTIQLPPAPTDAAWPGLVWAAAPLAFGFLLCPHLDLTLLRARIRAPGRTGDRAFLLGFGVFFLVMITGTLLYARAALTGWISYYLVGHFFVQSVFTMGLHLRELRKRGWLLGTRPLTPLLRFSQRAALLGALLIALSMTDAVPRGREGLYYNLFLWGYSLLFPAYVWIVALPRRRGLLPPVSLLIAGVALATPAFWLGAVEGRWVFLTLGVAIPLLAPLAAWALPLRTASPG